MNIPMKGYVMKVNKKLILISTLFCLVFFFMPGNAQYVIKNSVFSNGGAVITDSSNYNLRSIAGQGLIGESGDNSWFVYSGFLYSGGAIYTGIDDLFSDLPRSFELYQNYPNPFNPVTNIKFALPKTSKVKIDVFNILGQHVATLLNTNKPAGYHIINFDANRFASGLYFYTIAADNFYKVKKMMLVK